MKRTVFITPIANGWLVKEAYLYEPGVTGNNDRTWAFSTVESLKIGRAEILEPPQEQRPVEQGA